MQRFRNMLSQTNANEDEDPLAKLIAPPSQETQEERRVRLAQEAEAKRRSDTIDKELKSQALAEGQRRKCIRLLLLGVYLGFQFSRKMSVLTYPQVRVKLVCNLFSRYPLHPQSDSRKNNHIEE